MLLGSTSVSFISILPGRIGLLPKCNVLIMLVKMVSDVKPVIVAFFLVLGAPVSCVAIDLFNFSILLLSPCINNSRTTSHQSRGILGWIGWSRFRV